MADYAFPELHPDTALRRNSRNLLIYTRTSTDSSGRRKSVAVPLLPSSSSNSPRENGTPLVALERKVHKAVNRVAIVVTGIFLTWNIRIFSNTNIVHMIAIQNIYSHINFALCTVWVQKI